jgi:hypothetical protein
MVVLPFALIDKLDYLIVYIVFFGQRLIDLGTRKVNILGLPM